MLPASIQLGTSKNPVVPKLNWTLEDISYGEDRIQACLCTLPFCNNLPIETFKNARSKPKERERSESKLPKEGSAIANKGISAFPRANKGKL